MPAVLKKKEISTVFPAFAPSPGITPLALAESPSKIIGTLSVISVRSVLTVASTLFIEMPRISSGVELELIIEPTKTALPSG